MKALIAAGSNGVQMLLELPPEWITVGYGCDGEGGPIHAAIGLEYDATQLPIMQIVVAELKRLKIAPRVSIYDDGVQLVYSLSPIPQNCMPILRQFSVLDGVSDLIETLHISSVGNMWKEDDAYAIFRKCYERDRTISLLIMNGAVFGSSGNVGTPWATFALRNLEEKFIEPFELGLAA